MTTRLVVFALASLVPAAAAAQHFHHHVEATPDDDKRISVCVKPYATPTTIDDRLPKVPWEVTTGKTLAKQHFQQGMALYYGFNYEDALRNFRRATDLDGNFVMGWWGMALAAGPNINFLDTGDECLTRAQVWSLNAQRLAEQTLSPETDEYQLAKALAVRYAGPKVQTDAYADAMAAVWTKFKAGAHPDIGALYAESLMDKWPWDLWTPDHKEKHADTYVVLEVLEAVIAKHSNAVGANHYYIHAVEAGPRPEKAKTSADFLRDNGGSSGHLRHMPSHTYLLTGDYLGAVRANDAAVLEDGRFRAACFGTDGKKYVQYIEDPNCLQLYYGHYLAHNLYFRAVAKAFLGNFTGDKLGVGADVDARSTREHVEYFVANEPGLQRYMTAWLMLSVARGTWGEILDKERNALPPEECYSAPFQPTGCRILRSLWYWAQGMAHTSTQPPDRAAAGRELQAFLDEGMRIVPPGPTRWGNNSAADVLAIAKQTLQARIDWMDRNYDAAVKDLQAAVGAEDALIYDEPPQWVFPARQSLGGAYLVLRRYEEAKKTFLEDLAIHKENGRSLYGLAMALRSMDPPDQAWVDAWERHQRAWKWADGEMTVDSLWLLGMPAPPPPGPPRR